jgi:hypothetical protein
MSHISHIGDAGDALIESNVKFRFSDACDEPVVSSMREYEEKSFVSLIESIKPISELFKNIQDYSFVALHNSQNSTRISCNSSLYNPIINHSYILNIQKKEIFLMSDSYFSFKRNSTCLNLILHLLLTNPNQL